MNAMILLVLMTAAGAQAESPAPQGSKGPPLHAPPPYQMRAALPAGDRLVAGKDGTALFSNRCGACHLPGGMGTNLLTKQRVAAGQSPDSGLLANRNDLTQTYVKVIVRHGKLAMPRLSRVEVTDAELDSIAKFLGKAGP
jgi:mono/diheme cytochrome c family protein